MQRMTDKIIDAKCDTVNRLLGIPEDQPYSTEGAVRRYSAYGQTGVHRVTKGGGVDTIKPLGTKSEAAMFLDGMVAALRMVCNK